MPTSSPIFPVPEPHHFSDYGFDPQIDYFQVLEEARRHSKRAEPRAIDAIHFKLSKPISKDRDWAKPNKRKRWWKSALSFLKRSMGGGADNGDSEVTPYPYRAVCVPVYVTEPISGRSTPCRSARSLAASGPLTAAEVGGGVGMSYVSLRDLNVTDGHWISASNAPTPMPIYLVT